MLWRIDTPSIQPDNQLSQKLLLHLRYARISTVLVHIQGRQQHYVITEGCMDCRHERCQPSCRAQLLRRILYSYGIGMHPVPQGLAARPYTQLFLALPTAQACIPTIQELAPWPEARLQLTWSRHSKGLGLALLLALTDASDNAFAMLHSQGWRALNMPKLLVKHFGACPFPGHLMLPGMPTGLTPALFNCAPQDTSIAFLEHNEDRSFASRHTQPDHQAQHIAFQQPEPSLNFSVAYQRLLGLELGSGDGAQGSELLSLTLDHKQENNPLNQGSVVKDQGSEALRLYYTASQDYIAALPISNPQSLTPDQELPCPLQQLEQWVSILTGEATLHEGRPGRAGLAASRLAWALGIPMRTARMLMVWRDDAHLLASPSNPAQAWSGPRPLLTREAEVLLTRLKATAAPDEQRVQMAYGRRHESVIEDQKLHVSA